jgi:hypothetical protein
MDKSRVVGSAKDFAGKVPLAASQAMPGLWQRAEFARRPARRKICTGQAKDAVRDAGMPP